MWRRLFSRDVILFAYDFYSRPETITTYYYILYPWSLREPLCMCTLNARVHCTHRKRKREIAEIPHFNGTHENRVLRGGEGRGRRCRRKVQIKPHPSELCTKNVNYTTQRYLHNIICMPPLEFVFFFFFSFLILSQFVCPGKYRHAVFFFLLLLFFFSVSPLTIRRVFAVGGQVIFSLAGPTNFLRDIHDRSSIVSIVPILYTYLFFSVQIN